MLSIEHKNHGPGVLGALKLGGQATAQPKESRIEGDNSMSVSFPLDYHLGISRVFVPWVLPTQIHQARDSPAILPARATSHTSGHMRVYHRYFEHAKPGSAESAWENMCLLKVVLDIPEDGITETTFSNTQWGQQLKPVGLLDVVYGKIGVEYRKSSKEYPIAHPQPLTLPCPEALINSNA